MDMTQNPLACHWCGGGPVVAVSQACGIHVLTCRPCASPEELAQAERDAAAVQHLRDRRTLALLQADVTRTLSKSRGVTDPKNPGGR